MFLKQSLAITFAGARKERKIMEEKRETFTYTYSAKEQEEIKHIRDKYAPPTKEETSIDRLRQLDASTTRGATVVSLCVGIISSLILGVGMCCVMVPGWEQYFIPGIAVGIMGIIGVISSWPIYKRIVRRKRVNLAPEIMRISDELLR